GRRAQIAKRKTGTCTWCGGEVKRPRRTWCSKDCNEEYLRRQPDRLRYHATKRDKGKSCPLCGKTRYFPEVDHIVPIIEGGDPFDLENLRCICSDCHKRETAALAARRARRRRKQTDLFPEETTP